MTFPTLLATFAIFLGFLNASLHARNSGTMLDRYDWISAAIFTAGAITVLWLGWELGRVLWP